MSEPTATGGSAGTDSGKAARPAIESGAQSPTATDTVRNIATQLLALSDAQLTIWKMQLMRVVVLAALGIPAALFFFGLSVYGFVLLDKSADEALKLVPLGHPYSPAWFSPLVRGGLYSTFTLVVLATLWSRCIGSFSEKK